MMRGRMAWMRCGCLTPWGAGGRSGRDDTVGKIGRTFFKYPGIYSGAGDEWNDSAMQNARRFACGKRSFIPFAASVGVTEDSVLSSKPQIEMGEQSELIYGEIVAIGRVVEWWTFFLPSASFFPFEDLYLKDDGKKRPLVSDCIQWLPSQNESYRFGQMENYTHQRLQTYLSGENSRKSNMRNHYSLQQQWNEKIYCRHIYNSMNMV